MTDDTPLTTAIKNPERLAELRRLRLLDAPPEPAFDRLTRIASRMLNAPISLVTLIDEDRQYFLSCVGLPESLRERRETPLTYSVCKHVVPNGKALIAADISEHPLVEDASVARSFGIVGYAGIPLRTATGHVLGSFCVLDRKRREWTADEVELLETLAGSAVAEIELRSSLAREAEQAAVVRSHRDESLAQQLRLNTLVEGLDATVWEADPVSLAYTFISGHAATLLGVSTARLIEDAALWPSLIHPDDRTQVAEFRRAAARGGRHRVLEYRLVPTDGRTIWVRDHASSVMGRDPGEIDALRGVMVDVTARKAAEEELDARARQQAAVAALGLRALTPSSLREIFDEASSLVAATLGTECVAILEQSADGTRLDLRAGRGWNAGLIGTYSIPGGDQSMAGYSIAANMPIISECLRSETRFSVQSAIGDHEIVSAACVAIGGATGRTWGVLGAYTRHKRRFNEDDVNFLQALANTIAAAIDRRSAEEQLRLSGETLRTLIDSSPIGVIVTSIDDVVTLWNPAAEAMFGIPAADALGRPFPVSLEGESTERAMLADAIANDRPISAWRTRRNRADGTPIDISLWIVRLRDAAGRPDAVLSLVSDVTQQHLLETQLRQSQKMEAVGRLAGGVAHDFNNLLTVIRANADFVHAELAPGDERRTDVEEIRKAADRAAGLTRQLLVFSRRGVVQPKALLLNDVVLGMEQMLGRMIGEDVALASVLSPDIATVNGDQGQMEQVLLNLVVNSRDAMADGGAITITTENATLGSEAAGWPMPLKPGHYALLTVSDTGCGMSDDVQAHIFEPFFTTKEPGKGTGLGLSTVYGIVEQMEGSICVRSELGRGTSFAIYLPAIPGSVPEVAAAPVAPERERSSETILLVEDEPAVRRLARRALEAQGFHILEAASGAEALTISAAHAAELDMLLTDVVMPQMSGVELAGRLTASDPGLRVLYMSGYTEDALGQRGVLSPETAFLAKPFTPDVLVETVRAVLDRSRGQST
ncbi:MAG: GAF domain-containing protein [Gemmatimonadaceae bacterium]